MKSKKEIIEILKSFEQKDYKRGGVSIAPEMYEAIANKIWEMPTKKAKYNCYECSNSFMNPFDQYYCHMKNEVGEEFDIENNKDCGGKFFKKIKKYKL